MYFVSLGYQSRSLSLVWPEPLHIFPLCNEWEQFINWGTYPTLLPVSSLPAKTPPGVWIWRLGAVHRLVAIPQRYSSTAALQLCGQGSPMAGELLAISELINFLMLHTDAYKHNKCMHTHPHTLYVYTYTLHAQIHYSHISFSLNQENTHAKLHNIFSKSSIYLFNKGRMVHNSVKIHTYLKGTLKYSTLLFFNVYVYSNQIHTTTKQVRFKEIFKLYWHIELLLYKNVMHNELTILVLFEATHLFADAFITFRKLDVVAWNRNYAKVINLLFLFQICPFKEIPRFRYYENCMKKCPCSDIKNISGGYLAWSSAANLYLHLWVFCTLCTCKVVCFHCQITISTLYNTNAGVNQCIVSLI